MTITDTNSPTLSRTTRPVSTGPRLTRNQKRIRGIGSQDAATVVWQEALAYMLRRPGLDEYWASAVATEVYLQFRKRPSHYLAKYGSLRKFAVVAAKSRLLDLQGIERHQRGEGRTLVRTAEGWFRTRRYSVPNERFNEKENAFEPIEYVEADPGFVDRMVAQLDLQAAMCDLTDAERHALEAVIVEGRTTVEVGAAEGVAHSTIIKRNRKALEKALAALGDDYLAETA